MSGGYFSSLREDDEDPSAPFATQAAPPASSLAAAPSPQRPQPTLVQQGGDSAGGHRQSAFIPAFDNAAAAKMAAARVQLQRAYRSSKKLGCDEARHCACEAVKLFTEARHLLNYGGGLNANQTPRHPHDYLRDIECVCVMGEALSRVASLDLEQRHYDSIFADSYEPALRYIQEALTRADAVYAQASSSSNATSSTPPNDSHLLFGEVAVSVRMTLAQVQDLRTDLAARRDTLQKQLAESREERDGVKARMGDSRWKRQANGYPASSFADKRAAWVRELRQIQLLLTQMEACDGSVINKAEIFVARSASGLRG